MAMENVIAPLKINGYCCTYQCRSEGYVELGSVDRKISLTPLSLYLFDIYFWITAIKTEFTIFLPTPSNIQFSAIVNLFNDSKR